MGKLEDKNRKRRKKENLQKFVLRSVAVVGVLSVGLMAPNVIGAMDKLGIISYRRQRESVGSSASKLVRKGFLKFKDGYYQLTAEGEKILRKWDLQDYKLNKPKKWDRKWRIIVYDIPERKKGIRKQVLEIFNNAGMHRLQDSIWIYPYDCEDIIGLLKTDFGIGKDLLYIIADEIENDHHLRAKFQLKS